MIENTPTNNNTITETIIIDIIVNIIVDNNGRARKGPEIKLPDHQKLKVGIIGGGLAGMITAMDLSEAGHQVEIFEARPFMGGKVSGWVGAGLRRIDLHAV